MDDDGSNVTHLSDGSPGSIQFAPDDLKLIINRGPSGIWSMNTDGSEYKAIIDSISVGSSLPSIYTDSLGHTQIAFESGDIYIMDIDGTNLRNLTSTPDVRDRYPHFSPDGDSIVYTTDSDTLITISIIDKNGESSRILISNTPSTKLAQVYYYPRFNINGDKIYYIFFSELEGLYSINTDGTDNSLLFEGSVYTDILSMSNDWSKLVFSAESHIYILNTKDNGIVDLGIGRGPNISSDGSKVVFKGVKIMNSDGSGRMSLEYGWEPRFSHNKYNGHYKVVYTGERQIIKDSNKGIVF
ncbi:MAG: DUF5050 domain-containing protein [Candidatus Cloacimonetes bacterium]|nr:DUF5050 domain-containing protein [Candidatus Cloacimonadota bacterium]